MSAAMSTETSHGKELQGQHQSGPPHARQRQTTEDATPLIGHSGVIDEDTYRLEMALLTRPALPPEERGGAQLTWST